MQAERRRVVVRIRLTGGIGSGKSAVAHLFSAWGAVVIDADVLARDAVAPERPASTRSRNAGRPLSAGGQLDRAALGRIVFADPAARERLTAIVHPRVREAADTLETAAPAGALVVHVVPLLFEGDYWRTCDANVLVTAPRAVRIARVVARDGLRPEDIEARMSAQIDPERAAAMADFIIENDADIATLEHRARAVYDRLSGSAA